METNYRLASANEASWEKEVDEEEMAGAPNVSAAPPIFCSYCGFSEASSLVQCNACKRWFCNGRGSTTGSHIVTHLVGAKHREIVLHPDNPLGEDCPLECYFCETRNLFLLGFLPSKQESVVVLVCREPCLYSETLRLHNWNPDLWVPLVDGRVILSWLAAVPSKNKMDRCRSITNVQAAQLEDLWKTHPEGTLEDLVTRAAHGGNDPAFLPLPIRFTDGLSFLKAFMPLIEEECRVDQEVKESQHYDNLHVEWTVGINRRVVALVHVPTEDGKFTRGDELQLAHKPSKWKATCVLVHVVTLPTAGSQLHCELCDDSRGHPVKESGNFTVQFQFNKITFSRMMKAMTIMAKDELSLSAHLYNVLLGLPQAAATMNTSLPDSLNAPNVRTLNNSQQRAVATALRSPVSLIQGPPGTGKTATSATIVFQMCQLYHSQVLVCTPSNISSDELADRISQTGVKVLRVLARSRESIPTTVEHLTLHQQVRSFAASAPPTSDLNRLMRLQEEYGHLTDKDKRNLEALVRNVEHDFICNADVICTTCSVAGDKRLKELRFRYVLVDESTQAKEPETLIPLVKGAKQVVLVGDHCQMGPVVMSKPAEKAGLGRSMFERLIALGHRPTRIDVQYRMHPVLAEFCSNAFYEGSLQNGVTAQERDSGSLFCWPDPAKPMFFYNSNAPEELGTTGTSYINRTEAAIAEKILTTLIQQGADPTSIGVITPYEAQRSYLLNYIQRNGALPNEVYQLVEVASVDAFQGREKEFIIVSAVRSNDTQSIGFLSDWRRLNVALTRARRGLMIIGNGRVLSRNELWHRLLTHFNERNLVVEGSVAQLRSMELMLSRPRSLDPNAHGVGVWRNPVGLPSDARPAPRS